MAFVHGKKAVFKIDNSAGTSTDISAYCEEVSLSRSIETAETTTFGNDSKTYITGLTDATVSLSGKFDAVNASAVDSVLTGILGSAMANVFDAGSRSPGSAGERAAPPTEQPPD